jgi:methylmalonyl-CoA mutase N-terminal domain/subunit
MGGTQSLHTNSMDEALALPTARAVQTALRTQQVIAYETGAADTVDPLAGSYVIEHLTNEIEKRAQDYIERIDDLGGALQAIERGYINTEIQDAAYHYQRAVESGEEVIVGVNRFEVEETHHRDILKVDPAIETAQRQKLAALRATRDNAKVAELRTHLEATARSTANLMPLIIECVEHDVTLGEICHTLRGVFGEYRPSVRV